MSKLGGAEGGGCRTKGDCRRLPELRFFDERNHDNQQEEPGQPDRGEPLSRRLEYLSPGGAIFVLHSWRLLYSFRGC